MIISLMYGIGIIVTLTLILSFGLLRCFVRGKADKLLVITGCIGKDKTAKIMHGGITFVWPFFQGYDWLPLKPITTDINLDNALSKENIRIQLPCTFTLAVSKDNIETMNNAAVRLIELVKNESSLQSFIKDISFGQMRSVISSMTISEINEDRVKFQQNIIDAVGVELSKVGLDIITINIKDIKDDAGYIENLGKKAGAAAYAKAAIETAEQEKLGEIGSTNHTTEKRSKVAELEMIAVEQENKSSAGIQLSNVQLLKASKIATAEGESETRIKEAEAMKNARIVEAEAEQEILNSQLETEKIRKNRDTLAELAKTVPLTEALKVKAEAEGFAQGAKIRAEMEEQAKGIKEMYNAQAEGIKKIVEASGNNPQAAILFLMQEKLPDMLTTFAKAVSERKIDKLVVIDGSNKGSGLENLSKSLINSIPGFNESLSALGLSMPLLTQTPGDTQSPCSPNSLNISINPTNQT